MERNVGGSDRWLRIGLGAILLAVGILSFAGMFAAGGGTGMLVLRSLVVLVGAVFAVTGLVQTCPINSLLGINTFEGRAGR
jgi:hypothetical protein